MDHAVRVQRETTGPSRMRRSRAPMFAGAAVCVCLLGLSVYSLTARPAFIWGASAASASPRRAQAGTRMALFFLAQRVRQYREAEGAFPETLAALGEDRNGVTYTMRGDSTFELRAETVGGTPIVFRSTDNVDAFLGESALLLQGTGR